MTSREIAEQLTAAVFTGRRAGNIEVHLDREALVVLLSAAAEQAIAAALDECSRQGLCRAANMKARARFSRGTLPGAHPDDD